MLLFSVIVALVSTYLVFSQKVRTDIVMIHLLGFAAISSGVFVFTGSINAFLAGTVLFLASGIYWTASEFFYVLDSMHE